MRKWDSERNQQEYVRRSQELSNIKRAAQIVANGCGYEAEDFAALRWVLGEYEFIEAHCSEFFAEHCPETPGALAPVPQVNAP